MDLKELIDAVTRGGACVVVSARAWTRTAHHSSPAHARSARRRSHQQQSVIRTGRGEQNAEKWTMSGGDGVRTNGLACERGKIDSSVTGIASHLSELISVRPRAKLDTAR